MDKSIRTKMGLKAKKSSLKNLTLKKQLKL